MVLRYYHVKVLPPKFGVIQWCSPPSRKPLRSKDRTDERHKEPPIVIAVVHELQSMKSYIMYWPLPLHGAANEEYCAFGDSNEDRGDAHIFTLHASRFETLKSLSFSASSAFTSTSSPFIPCSPSPSPSDSCPGPPVETIDVQRNRERKTAALSISPVLADFHRSPKYIRLPESVPCSASRAYAGYRRGDRYRSRSRFVGHAMFRQLL